jgi:ABC-type multidrug transport system fused ATPase/permease subunit
MAGTGSGTGSGSGSGTEPSVIALVRDAVRDFTVIVKGEIALAQAELKRQAAAGAVGGALLAVVIALLATAGLFASIAFALGLYEAGLPLWASFLIVAGVYLLFAIVLVAFAMVMFRKIKGAATASRIANETKAYLQAALAPTKEIDVTVIETETVVTPDGDVVNKVTTNTRSVTLPARRPDATDPGAAPKA